MDDIDLLSQAELFRDVGPDHLEALAKSGRSVDLARNDVLFEENDEAGELFVVRSGRIAMQKRSPDGRSSLVALMEEGDLFGEMPFFDGDGRSAGAKALENSQVLAIPYPTLRELLEAEPHLLWAVAATLTRRLRTVDAALADSMFLDVTGRTAKRILELSGGQDEFALPVTQEELAGMVGASRERVNKAISAFIRLGWLDQRDRRYAIVDRDQLTRRSR